MGSGGKQKAAPEPTPVETPVPVTEENPQTRAISRPEQSPEVSPSLLDDEDKAKAGTGNLLG